ncbi:outer membrane protein transport protein [uncultured Mailhella sp.]|uniref:OmpP1/FadL family transporter n=1 Tax=uncultured Mailhella sp. TaxID=1981031 RepID=UPI0025F3036F|nr:outer membrane protein transport protein [uncultured Mailhella sp.]
MNRFFSGARLCGALLVSLTLLFPVSRAQAEGFAIMENSARGMALAGGLIARGGDPSTLAYNPAAMTLLDGTQMQANLAVSQFYWGVDTRTLSGQDTGNYHSAHQTWPIPSFYITHQINDNVWFGLASYTRFGLGVKYPHNWPGGANLHSVQLITNSLNPSIAYKFNDHLSIAAGVEMMSASMQMRKNLDVQRDGLGDLNLNGHGVSFGGNVALHLRLNDQWSMGLTYRAPMSLKVNGKTRYDTQFGKMFSPDSPYYKLQNSRLRGTLHLPDSIGFGVAYKPTENLSFEADAVYTLWSRFRDFNIYMKDPVNMWENSDRHWRNSWTLGISGEYKPVDWMALRLGFMYETSPMNLGNADYMVPSNGRNYYTAGVGFFYKNWTIDLAYMYIHNHVLDYTNSALGNPSSGVVPGRTTHPHAHNFGIGIGYKF